MNVEKARSIVLGRWPNAQLLSVWTTSTLERRYVVIDGTTFHGRWLTGRHKTWERAWQVAARTARRELTGGDGV